MVWKILVVTLVGVQGLAAFNTPYSFVPGRTSSHMHTLPPPCSTHLSGRTPLSIAHARMGLFDGVFGGGQGGTPATPPGKKVQFGPLQVSEMGIGTWAWGNKLLWGYDESMDAELQEVFNLCVSSGVNLFDTGDSYGTGKLEGQSEKLLGKFMQEYAAANPGKPYPYIATKLATYPWRLTSESMVGACKASAGRLRRPVDVGQIHWSAANYAPWQEGALWEGIARMQKEGLVKTVGVSNYGPKQLRKVHAYLEGEGVQLASNQIQYSLLSRTVGDEVKEVCDELGIAMIAYSPLGLGVLGGKYRIGGEMPGGARGFVLKQKIEEAEPLLRVLEEVAKARSKTMAQVAINWCMCKGAVPIPGAKSISQARDSLGAMGWRLTRSEVDALDVAAKGVRQELVQNIFQTS